MSSSFSITNSPPLPPPPTLSATEHHHVRSLTIADNSFSNVIPFWRKGRKLMITANKVKSKQ